MEKYHTIVKFGQNSILLIHANQYFINYARHVLLWGLLRGKVKEWAFKQDTYALNVLDFDPLLMNVFWCSVIRSILFHPLSPSPPPKPYRKHFTDANGNLLSQVWLHTGWGDILIKDPITVNYLEDDWKYYTANVFTDNKPLTLITAIFIS